ncbi:MAG: HAMP domain-containing histidine kinase [Calditrichaceae bacterium]|nr:HAMP domain-containing histidine kinase [Calditrichaceae bacterium]MBN2708295.1 HAMP domain-containing histidine kinase [Calditrichaceae bacterium]RQV91937.1 MAG: sensor histidine kinase [Calditrichota bacterium]
MSPVKLVHDYNLPFDEELWLTWCKKKIKKTDIKSGQLAFGDYLFFLLGYTSADHDFFIIVFDQIITSELLLVIKIWSKLIRLINNSTEFCIRSEREISAALISQILHDVHSFINLTDTEKTNEEVKQRIKYHKTLSEELLFYIRDMDLIMNTLPVKDLILSSLQMGIPDYQKLKIAPVDEFMEINADAELFSKAFNAVIANSLIAVENRLQNIAIKIEEQPSKSPFLPFNWIKIEVTDKGTGIIDDYKQFVKSPFFTTRKASGAVGFGLTNAEKIIKAHRGFIHIKDNKPNGICVQIFIPEK